ncbi:MAG: preprotein translocase subunit SecE [Nitrospinae bacterium]|nr:preprotein translocase subunit SecE [Nitrospinota bacterium]
MIEKTKEFLSEVKVEVRKVTWPSRKEAMGGTLVVLVVVFFVSLYLGIIDSVLAKLMRSLI